jgi:transcriptional regulator GlxA family with amidase domain
MNQRINTSDIVISGGQQWIADDYHLPNPVQNMAERAGLNIRALFRRLRAATGHSPIMYVQALRVEEARSLLETDQDSAEDFSVAAGYDDPASFRRISGQPVR